MHTMDVRLQKGEGEGDAASKDLQSVHTRIAINYHLDPEDRPSTSFATSAQHRHRGRPHHHPRCPGSREGRDRPLHRPKSWSATAPRCARPSARCCATRCSAVGLVLDEFAIVNFAFSRSFAEAIELKVKAEQEKPKAERDLQRIEVEAKQKVASARAEAEALALQRQQITPDLLALRRIENEREAIRKWDGKLPNVTSGAVPFINVKRQELEPSARGRALPPPLSRCSNSASGTDDTDKVRVQHLGLAIAQRLSLQRADMAAGGLDHRLAGRRVPLARGARRG